MRIEEIIGEIAKSAEYLDLARLWDLMKDNPELAPMEIRDGVCGIVDFLEEELSKARKNFLKSIVNGWRPKNGKISNGAVDTFYFIAPENVQREWKTFIKETERQMPAYKLARYWCEKSREETDDDEQ